MSLVRFSFSVVSSLFLLVRSVFSLSSLSFSADNPVILLFSLVFSSWNFLSASSFFKASFGFSWVSLEGFPNQWPIKREIFIKGSRSSNLSPNFLMRSLRSVIDFKSSSLLGGGGSSGIWSIWFFYFLIIRIFYTMSATHKNISFFILYKC
ncbi:hypothetical protein HPHPH24C_0145 [Helicobacter pylori Hp H-24c]|nr:hypothetical protein HPHPH24C_0145 [Helicobacter pylori Hp H-24c]